jgi:hypothetical protein
MPSPIHDFYFDVNFNFAMESVFTTIDEDEGAPFPPAPGYFLLLDGTNFLLLNGTNFDLL